MPKGKVLEEIVPNYFMKVYRSGTPGQWQEKKICFFPMYANSANFYLFAQLLFFADAKSGGGIAR
jgi:hypothetical protein